MKINLAFSFFDLYKIFEENEKKNSIKDIVNSIAAIDIVKVSQLHIRFVTFWMFKDMIFGKLSNIKCPKNRENMTNLCILYGLNQLNSNMSGCYESGYFKNGVNN